MPTTADYFRDAKNTVSALSARLEMKDFRKEAGELNEMLIRLVKMQSLVESATAIRAKNLTLFEEVR